MKEIVYLDDDAAIAIGLILEQVNKLKEQTTKRLELAGRIAGRLGGVDLVEPDEYDPVDWVLGTHAGRPALIPVSRELSAELKGQTIPGRIEPQD